jgi:hypothetical protein
VTGWHEQAACRDHPEHAPDVWYPTATSIDDPVARAAITVCEACPVTAECLEYALAREDAPGTRRWGIWGGLTADQRSRLRRPERTRPRDDPRIRQQVRDHAARGATDREIGASLGITAEVVRRIRNQMGVPSGKSVREALTELGTR